MNEWRIEKDVFSDDLIVRRHTPSYAPANQTTVVYKSWFTIFTSTVGITICLALLAAVPSCLAIFITGAPLPGSSRSTDSVGHPSLGSLYVAIFVHLAIAAGALGALALVGRLIEYSKQREQHQAGEWFAIMFAGGVLAAIAFFWQILTRAKVPYDNGNATYDVFDLDLFPDVLPVVISIGAIPVVLLILKVLLAPTQR